MKFQLKMLAAAAAIASSGLAMAGPITANADVAVTVTDPSGSGRQAQLTLLGTSNGALGFSTNNDPNDTQGLVNALDIANVKVQGIGGGIVHETMAPDASGDAQRVGIDISANVVSLQADDKTGQILSVQSTGGALQTGGLPTVMTGGQVSVANLRFDLVNKFVYADVIGHSNAVGTKPAADWGGTGIQLWSIGAISGPVAIPPAALLAADPAAAMTAAGFNVLGSTVQSDGSKLYNVQAKNVLSNLKVTQVGFDIFKNGFGLKSQGVSTLSGVNDFNDPSSASYDPAFASGWGAVSATINFTVKEVPTVPSVPEPSTYAMTLTGLVLVGAVAARRRRRSA